MRRILAADVIAVSAIVASFGATALSWASLPDRVPIHFDIHGTANGFAPRGVGALLLPAISAGVWLLVRLGAARLPVGESNGGPGNTHAIAAAACATVSFLFAIHLGALRAASTGKLPGSFLPLALGGFCLALSVLLPRLRRNAFVGIRTAWALASDENWARTHRVGSYSMLGAAIACFAAALSPVRAAAVPVAAVVIAGLVPAIYSAVIARRSAT